eukprot:TRINITY_DN2074_c0_g7_i1.p1 TRINITY_DN2074_c0_g7~~TRINITY_DN2074_c0_g7_i1.p1  ORF type:complete len:224 (-),score=38.43 TRINITY_DN2074_c0_g7_i1:53-724(-)
MGKQTKKIVERAAALATPSGSAFDQGIKKKKRVKWTTELNEIFMEVLQKLGDKAVPSAILREMKVCGLTRENVASHLQKYRTQLREGSFEDNNDHLIILPRERPSGSVTPSASTKCSPSSTPRSSPTPNVTPEMYITSPMCPAEELFFDKQPLQSFVTPPPAFLRGPPPTCGSLYENHEGGVFHMPGNQEDAYLQWDDSSFQPHSNSYLSHPPFCATCCKIIE